MVGGKGERAGPSARAAEVRRTAERTRSREGFIRECP
jgi:hypothetical protein